MSFLWKDGREAPAEAPPATPALGQTPQTHDAAAPASAVVASPSPETQGQQWPREDLIAIGEALVEAKAQAMVIVRRAQQDAEAIRQQAEDEARRRLAEAEAEWQRWAADTAQRAAAQRADWERAQAQWQQAADALDQALQTAEASVQQALSELADRLDQTWGAARSAIGILRAAAAARWRSWPGDDALPDVEDVRWEEPVHPDPDSEAGGTEA